MALVHHCAAASAVVVALAVGASWLPALAEEVTETVPVEEALAFIEPLDLSGRWSGPGTVKPVRRAEQPFKCVATYFAGKANRKLKQNLRCSNEDYKLDVATLMQIDGNKITGTWQEKTYSLEGTLTGEAMENRMEVRLKGQFFKADMIIVNSPCQQDVIVTPIKADQIEYLKASLKKC